MIDVKKQFTTINVTRMMTVVSFTVENNNWGNGSGLDFPYTKMCYMF